MLKEKKVEKFQEHTLRHIIICNEYEEINGVFGKGGCRRGRSRPRGEDGEMKELMKGGTYCTVCQENLLPSRKS